MAVSSVCSFPSFFPCPLNRERLSELGERAASVAQEAFRFLAFGVIATGSCALILSGSAGVVVVGSVYLALSLARYCLFKGLLASFRAEEESSLPDAFRLDLATRVYLWSSFILEAIAFGAVPGLLINGSSLVFQALGSKEVLLFFEGVGSLTAALGYAIPRSWPSFCCAFFDEAYQTKYTNIRAQIQKTASSSDHGISFEEACRELESEASCLLRVYNPEKPAPPVEENRSSFILSVIQTLFNSALAITLFTVQIAFNPHATALGFIFGLLIDQYRFAGYLTEKFPLSWINMDGVYRKETELDFQNKDFSQNMAGLYWRVSSLTFTIFFGPIGAFFAGIRHAAAFRQGVSFTVERFMERP